MPEYPEEYKEYIESFAAELFAMVKNYPELEGWRATVEADYLKPAIRELQEMRRERTELIREMNQRAREVREERSHLLITRGTARAEAARWKALAEKQQEAPGG